MKTKHPWWNSKNSIRSGNTELDKMVKRMMLQCEKGEVMALEDVIKKYETARESMKRMRARSDEMMVVNTIIEDLHNIRKEKPKVKEVIQRW